jgi:OPA family glycerol-3-phosphate transporter-like MFS transporter
VTAPPGGDRAYRRAQWRILLATSFCYLFYYTGRQNFGWAIAGLREDLALTNAQIGWISGAGLVFYGAGQVVSGYLGDRLGGRRIVALGALASCALNWVTSFGQGFWSLAVPWALNGYAQSMGFAPATRLIVSWWGERERGRAFGVFTFAAGFSSVVTFAGAIWVLGRFSWPWVFRLPVLLLPVGAAVFYWLSTDHPADLGLVPPDQAGAPALRASTPSIREGLGAVLSDRRFLVASLGFGFTNWARLGLLGWVPVHFLGPAWRTEPAGAWVTVALPVGMALGALATGLVTDRFAGGDHGRLIAASLILASVASLALLGVPRTAWLPGIGLLFLAGFFLFGPIAAFTALAAGLLDRRVVGTGVGVLNAVGYAVAAVGDPIVGMVIDRSGRTESVFLVTAIVCVAGAVCGHLARR